MFITFEGIEGSGKSSLIAQLKKYFKSSKLEAFFSKEPGGTDLGKEIRKILLNPKYSFDPTSELLLLLADRAEHVQKIIRPNLQKNKLIFCDRYLDSTLAYQGSGRNLDKKIIKKMFKALDFPIPDLTILLDVPVQIGLSRARKRNKLDRFEKEDLNFHENVRRSYLDLAKNDSARIVLFDSSISEEELFKKAVNLIKSRISG
jgi:dTMP kinase